LDIEGILKEAVSRHASDLHLTVEAPPSFRIGGELVRGESETLRSADTADALARLAGPQDKTVLDLRGQVNFSYSLSGVGRFRVNAFRQRGSVAISIRILWPKVPSLGELSLPLVVAELAMRPSGLVLVTGHSGCGKSSTLAGMVNLINENRNCHVITLEDPIEYLHRHKRSIVNQREVGSDTPSFEEGLRSVLREDPDIVMAGYLGDAETIRLAMAAAETGHLVLAAMHTTSAANTVARIVDISPPHLQQQVKVQLAAVLAGVVTQQLIPRMDEPGRVPACEILIGSGSVRNLIREGRVQHLQSAIQTGSRSGMRTMEQSLKDLHERHLISLEEYRARHGSEADKD